MVGGGGGGGAVAGAGGDGGDGGAVLGERRTPAELISDVLGVRRKPTPESDVLGARLSPITGDDLSLNFWILIFCIAGAVIMGMIYSEKEKKEEKRAEK